MTGWTKFYSDGTKLIGDDLLVKKKLVSWQNSRNDSIIGVELVHNGKTICIKGEGEYWQSDTYEVIFPASRPTMIKRRIMKKLCVTDRFFKMNKAPNILSIDFTDIGNRIDRKYQWIVLEHHIESGNSYIYFNNEKF